MHMRTHGGNDKNAIAGGAGPRGALQCYCEWLVHPARVMARTGGAAGGVDPAGPGVDLQP